MWVWYASSGERRGRGRRTEQVMLQEWSVRGERKRNPVGVGEKERGEKEAEMKKRKLEKLICIQDQLIDEK